MNFKLINKVGKIVFISTLLTIIIYAIFTTIRDERELKKESRITIGYVSDWNRTKSSVYIIYSYSVNGVDYTGAGNCSQDPKEYVGKRYFVRYSPSNPPNSRILLFNPVPDKLKEAPINGWKSTN